MQNKIEIQVATGAFILRTKLVGGRNIIRDESQRRSVRGFMWDTIYMEANGFFTDGGKREVRKIETSETAPMSLVPS